MTSYEFVVDDDAERLKAVAVEVIDSLGFETKWTDDWNAVVQRGSRTRSVLLGAFSPFVRIDLAIRSLDAGGVEGAEQVEDEQAEVEGAEWAVLRLDNRSSGLAGGVMGAKKTRSGWIELRRALAQRLAADDRLIEERDPGPSQIV